MGTTTKKTEGIVQAAEILDAIKRGENTEYDNVTIEDDLDLNELRFRKDDEGKFFINSQIRIRKFDNSGNCKI